MDPGKRVTSRSCSSPTTIRSSGSSRRRMRAEGLRIEEASDGVEALEVASRIRPDLILLDVQMPGKDGFAVLEELRREPQLRFVPVLVMTGCEKVNVALASSEKFGMFETPLTVLGERITLPMAGFEFPMTKWRVAPKIDIGGHRTMTSSGARNFQMPARPWVDDGHPAPARRNPDPFRLPRTKGACGGLQ